LKKIQRWNQIWEDWGEFPDGEILDYFIDLCEDRGDMIEFFNGNLF
jgi:acid phosphatase class B